MRAAGAARRAARHSGAAGAGRGEQRHCLPGSPLRQRSRHRGRGGPGLPQRDHGGRVARNGRDRGPCSPPCAACTGSCAAPRAAQRQREPGPAASAEGRGGERGATFGAGLEGTGGAALTGVSKAPLLGDPAASHVRGDRVGAGGSDAAAPCPPGTRPHRGGHFPSSPCHGMSEGIATSLP